MAQSKIEKADSAIQKALTQRIQLGNTEAVNALRELVQWTPGTFPFKKTVYDEDPGEAEATDAPFFTEAYLYALVGKSHARTLLALIYNLASSLGVEDPDQFFEETADAS